MKAGGGPGQLIAITAAGILAACATPPEPRPGITSDTSISPTPSPPPLEQHFLEQAQALMRQERWSEAAVQWEVLQLLHPDVSEYTQRLDTSRARARQTAAQHLEMADDARQRGNPDQAMVAYLKSLLMDPANKTALAGLRRIETERASMAYPNKASRPNGMPRRNHAPTTAKAQPAPYGGTRQVLDVGILLFRQGDYAASIQTLEKYLRGDPQDESGRRYLIDAYLQIAQQRLRAGRREEALASMEKARSLKGQADKELAEGIQSLRHSLADEYYEKGVRAYYSDIGKAIAFWERGLQFNPYHKLSHARLNQARKAQQNLRALEGKSTP